MKKRMIALLMTMLMMGSALMTGCGGQSESESSSESAETKEESSGDAVTISLLSWNNEENMTPFIEAFEAENPGIKVDLQYVPPVQQYLDKFMVLSAADQMTDMFYTTAENKKEVFEKGLAEDISDLEIFQRIDEKVSGIYGQDGKIYAFSPDAWVGGIFYNQDLFEQAGISEVPATWDEFIDCCNKLQDIGVIPYLDDADNVNSIPQTLYQCEVISQNPEADQEINEGQATFVDYYTKPFEEWYDDMLEPGLYDQMSLGLSAEQVTDMFATGQVAMVTSGPWNLEVYREKNPDLKFDSFPLSDKNGNVVLTGALNAGLPISSTSEHKEECKKFIEFMAEDENLLKWQETSGNAIVVEGIDYELDPVLDKYKDYVVDGAFYYTQVEWKNSAGIFKEMIAAVQDVIAGADTIENVPKRLDEKNKELDE